MTTKSSMHEKHQLLSYEAAGYTVQMHEEHAGKFRVWVSRQFYCIHEVLADTYHLASVFMCCVVARLKEIKESKSRYHRCAAFTQMSMEKDTVNGLSVYMIINGYKLTVYSQGIQGYSANGFPNVTDPFWQISTLLDYGGRANNYSDLYEFYAYIEMHRRFTVVAGFLNAIEQDMQANPAAELAIEQ